MITTKQTYAHARPAVHAETHGSFRQSQPQTVNYVPKTGSNQKITRKFSTDYSFMKYVNHNFLSRFGDVEFRASQKISKNRPRISRKIVFTNLVECTRRIRSYVSFSEFSELLIQFR